MEGNSYYIIKSKARFTIFIIMLIIVSVSIISLTLGFDNASGKSISEYETIEVSRGDTLWDIANEHKSQTKDTRKAIYTICDINNVSANTLEAGMIIKIPKNL